MSQSVTEILSGTIPRPLSDLGRAALKTYAALPGVADWTPPANLQPMQAHRVLEIAWPFVILGENPSLNRLVQKAAGRKFLIPEWSVIHAGAMLTKLGAQVTFPEEENQRTPDIRASWDGAIVDAEVTTPLTKERQDELQVMMEVIRQVISSDTRTWHPLIHLAALPTADVQSQILDAVVKLAPGQRSGGDQAWEVYAVPADQPMALVERDRLDALRPDWWQDDGPTLLNTSLTMSPDPQHERRTLICSKLPFLSYLNSIRSKVDRPQRDLSHPYLVMVDQSAMPLRHPKLQQELADWWSQWDHVGGILCFDMRPAYCRPFNWQLSFHPNPHAALRLPAALLSVSPTDQIGVDFFA